MKTALMTTALLSFLILPWAQAHEHHNHKMDEHAETTTLSDDSIYNSDAKLLGTDGKETSLKELRGSPVVISMAYTSCAYACPMILAQMQKLEAELVKTGKKDVKFVLVSFDPKKDTPAVMKAYGEKRKLGSQWKLFTAKDDKAPREIANLLDIKYKKMENGMDYDHSFVIAVLGADGVVKGRQVGADKEPKDLAKFIP